MATEDYFKARAAAGRAALSIATELSAEASADLIRGAAAGFLLAGAELEGWDSLLHHINELARAARVPAGYEKPKLCIVSGGNAA